MNPFDAFSQHIDAGLPLSSMMGSPLGQNSYRQLSVPQRLALLQQPGATMTPADEALLRLLRQRREQEAGVRSMAPPDAEVLPTGATGGMYRDAVQRRQSLLDVLAAGGR